MIYSLAQILKVRIVSIFLLFFTTISVAQSITNVTTATQACASEQLSVAFTVTSGNPQASRFTNATQFTFELSTSAGAFPGTTLTTTTISTLPPTGANGAVYNLSFNVTLPTSISGSDYRIRITSTSPGATGTQVGVFQVSNPVAGTVSSNQGICPNTSPNDIVVTGSSGTIQWQSSIDNVVYENILGATNSTLLGSAIGVLSTTTYFRAVVTLGPCDVVSSTVTVTIASTTWDGTTWSNGSPTSTSVAIFTGNYASVLEITACSIQVTNNATVTVLSGADVTLSGTIVVDSGSSFTLESNVNLFQSEGVANASAISIKRETSDEVMRLDYNMWSSPVSGQNLLAFSPMTLANRFYTYNPGTNQYNSVAPSSTNFNTGTGYLIRMPNNSPETPAAWEGTFTGVPFNGDLTITVGEDTFNAVGNPYPSTIEADKFFLANTAEAGNGIYFWRKKNNSANSSYATLTTLGGAANEGGDSAIIPNGIIQVGQGFIYKTTTATSIFFTNEMRLSNHENQFLRTNTSNAVTTLNKSRIWLNITSNVGMAGQLLVGYMTGATEGVDFGIDGKYINDSQNAFTSLINGEEFIIQGRSLPFSAADVVPLGFKTTQAGLYTISINQVDGLFDDASQPIYIKDNLTGAEHNLKVSPYEFTSAVGVFNARFELTYQTTLNVVQPSTAKNVLVYKQDQELKIIVTETDLVNVTVYDLTGRVIATRDTFNTNEASLSLGMLSNQVVLVKVVTTAGEQTQKVLW